MDIGVVYLVVEAFLPTGHAPSSPVDAQNSSGVAVMSLELTATNNTPATTVQHLKAQSTPVTETSDASNSTGTESASHDFRQVKRRVSNRKRQKTITLCSQLSQDIDNVFKDTNNEVTQQTLAEIQSRVQALVLMKESEWNEKYGKLHEECGLWEHKAVSRGLIIPEYDRVIKNLVETLKSTTKKSGQQRGQNPFVGGPGPEKVVFPEEIMLIQKERDQFAEEAMSWETSYDELYKRYEKLRQASLEIRHEDDELKQAYKNLEERYGALEQNFQALRMQAERELERANVELDQLEKARENDSLGLRLKVKHLEAKNNALSISLEAKTKELSEMEALFEDVVSKAGGM
uniref:TACC_C domain-containing protein n=1 Tax=Syphacia muris TaxID=451379 RepID=A0A0N5ADR7_9BILA